ncbi:MAG: hypothetical protein PWQ12_126 [Clostridiales bacterium]|jgi:hypothetical protein|nr:hypothetical protein [Clostridiales bacterium]
MSFVEMIFVGLIVLFFLAVMGFSWHDLILEKRYYREKSKNVTPMSAFKHKRPVKSRKPVPRKKP